MTGRRSLNMAVVVGVLALVACGETTTEPEVAGPQPPIVPSFATASNSWIARRSLTPTRYALASATVPNAAGESVVYAIAGRLTIDNRASRRVQAYNVATNSWTDKAPLPIVLYSTNGAGAIDGKIYVTGGLKNNRGAVSKLYKYNPATNVWIQKRSMPGPGYSGVTGVINGQLYVLTGCYGDGICDPFVPVAFYRYNPATDRWTSLLTPSNAHREAVGGVIGGKFYVAGGHNSFGQLDVYDPATNLWTTKTPMSPVSTERSFSAGAVLGGKLYVIGGAEKDIDGHEMVVGSTIAYDAATDTWTEKASLPTPMYGAAASRVVVNGQVRIEVTGLGYDLSMGNNFQYKP
jgi:N-acetylneuraminic acid mutarotase